VCACTGLYEFLRDQGSFIGGLLALIAGVLAYLAGLRQAVATKLVSEKQIALNNQRDHLQANCLAVGIYTELLTITATRERVLGSFNRDPSGYPGFDYIIRSPNTELKIFDSPLITQNVQYLYLLQTGGATIFQLLGVIKQYNGMIDTLARDVVLLSTLNAEIENFKHHFQLIGELLEKAEREIKPIHDGVFLTPQ
jgi:hypothetical protein